MSKVDIVKRSYVAFAAGDMEGVLGDMHPEIEWHQAQGLPHGGLYRGLEDVKRNIFDPLDEEWWDEFAAEPDEFLDAGSEVVVVGRYRGTAKGTGKQLDVPFVHIWRGLAIVPENRRLFAPMTVLENLELGAYLRGGGDKEDFDRVYELFPLLYERRSQLAGTLSGGEQQMVAMGRALMSRPKLLLMDEPSMGLAPILVERNFEIIKQVHESGVAMLVVEQNANVSLSIADRGYVLSTGRLVLEGKAADLRENEDLRKAYLGR